ncbi:MAG: TIGR02147 family protein, partial [Pseudobdellovibrionaceae bacterium]
DEWMIATKPAPEAIVPAPDLSDYMDYRQFLRDFYRYKKFMSRKDLRPYNYAVFSAGANIKSPNYLKLIIEGKRNLSEDMIAKFAKALGFNKEQSIEFYLLVMYSQTLDPVERNRYMRDLNERRVEIKLKTGEIDKRAFEKVPSWISWVLYALVDQEGVQFTSEGLRSVMRKKASADEIENALTTLFAAGDLIKDSATGIVTRPPQKQESGDEIPVALIRKLQSELMYLGLESLFQDPPTEREFGSLTMSLTKAEFEEIKFKLRQMRKSIHKDYSIKRMQDKGERVYQINLQLFALTNATQNSAVSEPEDAAIEGTIETSPAH